mmetsp:Transcript_46866/g.100927  ORF Transcript_46866/g.100927 Transcript_46866/m.100927 type:complete len:285 (-) Transcript_46866:682-1536(-)
MTLCVCTLQLWGRHEGLDGSVNDAGRELVHRAMFSVDVARLAGGLNLLHQLHLLRRPGTAAATLREGLHAVAGDLLHEDPAVAFGKLAALEVVHLLEARAGHQGEAADLLLKSPAQVDGGLNVSHLGGSDGLDELVRWDLLLHEALREALVDLVAEALEVLELCLGLFIEGLQLGNLGQGDTSTLGSPAHLVVAVLASAGIEAACEDQRRPGDDGSASVESLSDHVHRSDALLCLHVLALLIDVAISRQERRLGNAGILERDPGVVQVVADGLHAHVSHLDALH